MTCWEGKPRRRFKAELTLREVHACQDAAGAGPQGSKTQLAALEVRKEVERLKVDLNERTGGKTGTDIRPPHPLAPESQVV